ncbi:hypothetical protein ACFSQJ_03810 [Croceitalea marina]|uniref:DinB-like domain-containing protein n=1 Tax=Croceitalea marina TaxID=1775166 RepID=A0ABW5MUA7_9FLAO
MTNKELAIASVNTVRGQFHLLVNGLKEEHLSKPSKFTKRTIRGVLAHIIIATDRAYPMLLEKAKKSKPMPLFFGTALGHYFSYRYSEYAGSRIRFGEMIGTYEKAHEKLVQLIVKIEDDEWQLTTKLPKPSNRSLTILELFTYQVPHHFKVHRDEITKTIS